MKRGRSKFDQHFASPVLLSGLVLLLWNVGCGQNPHVIGPLPQGATTPHVTPTVVPSLNPAPNPSGWPGPHPSNEPTPSPVGTPEPKPEPKPSLVPPPAPKPSEAPPSPVPPAPKPSVVPPPPQNPDCHTEDYAATFPARPLTDPELASTVLPYMSLTWHRIPVLQIGQATGTDSLGTYVKRSQVTFAFDAKLPALGPSDRLVDAVIEMDFAKLTYPDASDTDLLCLLDQKLCSGTRYQGPIWGQNLNPDFWDHDGLLTASYYEDEIERLIGPELHDPRHAKEVCLYRRHLRAHFSDLFPGTDVEEIFYPGEHSGAASERTLKFSTADNLFIPDAQLVLRWTRLVCSPGKEYRGNG